MPAFTQVNIPYITYAITSQETLKCNIRESSLLVFWYLGWLLDSKDLIIAKLMGDMRRVNVLMIR